MAQFTDAYMRFSASMDGYYSIYAVGKTIRASFYLRIQSFNSGIAS